MKEPSKRWQVASHLIGAGTVKKKIEFILPYVRGKEVLDIGCAESGMEDTPYEKEDWLHKHIKFVSKYCLGIDYDKNMVNKLIELGYNVIHGDAQNFSMEKKFDIVCALDVIEHIEDVKGFLISVSKVLKPDAKLILTTPNPWFFQRFIRCFFKGDGGAHPEHVHWFCNITIVELLRRYQFKVEKIVFGSGEPRFYKYIFLPQSLRHTSIWIIAHKLSSPQGQ
jgi:2-polyprenyl-3-methyl-5-hydroxy-6-metoxy-1,4-benzoquinol methylase